MWQNAVDSDYHLFLISSSSASLTIFGLMMMMMRPTLMLLVLLLMLSRGFPSQCRSVYIVGCLFSPRDESMSLCICIYIWNWSCIRPSVSVSILCLFYWQFSVSIIIIIIWSVFSSFEQLNGSIIHPSPRLSSVSLIRIEFYFLLFSPIL